MGSTPWVVKADRCDTTAGRATNPPYALTVGPARQGRTAVHWAVLPLCVKCGEVAVLSDTLTWPGPRLSWPAGGLRGPVFRVLVVDDEPDLRFVLRRLFERAGHE